MMNYALAVLAQAIPLTPTPDAPLSSEQLRFLDALADRFQQVAAADSTTVNFAVVIIGIGFLLFMASVFIAIVWVARGGLNTFVGMIKDANRRAEDAEDGKDKATETVERELERRRKVDEQQLENSKAQTKTLLALEQSLNSPMTRLQPVVDAINTHADTKLDEAISELKAIRNDMISKRDLDDYTKKLDEALAKLEETKTPAPPAETAPQSRANMVEVEAGEKE